MCTFSPQEEARCTPPTENPLQLRAVVGLATFAYSRIPALPLYHIQHRMSRAPAEIHRKKFLPLRGRSLRSLPRLRYAHPPRRCAPRPPAGGRPPEGAASLRSLAPPRALTCRHARAPVFSSAVCVRAVGWAVGARALRGRSCVNYRLRVGPPRPPITR